MTVLRNITEFPQTVRWGDPAGSFVEVAPGETVDVPAAFVQSLLDKRTESLAPIWEEGDGEASTAAPSGELPPEAPVATGESETAGTGESEPASGAQDEDEEEEEEGDGEGEDGI